MARERMRTAGRWTIAVALLCAIAAVVWLLASGGRPAQATGTSMDLQVFADKAKSVLVCDIGQKGRKCDVPANSGFSIDVIATSPPSAGYTAYQTALRYTSTISLQQQPGLGETRGPACASGTEVESGPVSGLHIYRLQCFIGVDTSFSGAIVNVQFVCGQPGTSAEIALLGGAGSTSDDISYYWRFNIFGSIFFLKSQIAGSGGATTLNEPPVEFADSVSINCVESEPTPTSTPTDTATPVDTPTATPPDDTPTPTDTPDTTATPTDTPDTTATPTDSPTSTATPSRTATPLASATPTSTATPSATPTSTVTPSATPTATTGASATPTSTAVTTPSATAPPPTDTPTAAPTDPATATPTATEPVAGVTATPVSNVPGDLDCDGKVTSRDALIVLQFDVALITSIACIKNGDVNCDSLINALDAALILQLDAGLLDELTSCLASSIGPVMAGALRDALARALPHAAW